MPATTDRPRFRLGRRQRLHGARQFTQVRNTGERRVSGCLIFNWRRADPGMPSRLGVVTSRKLGGAVVRSRVRRILRETFRQHQHGLNSPVDLVLVARPSLVHKALPLIQRDFRRGLSEAGLWSAKDAPVSAPAVPGAPSTPGAAPAAPPSADGGNASA